MQKAVWRGAWRPGAGRSREVMWLGRKVARGDREDGAGGPVGASLRPWKHPGPVPEAAWHGGILARAGGGRGSAGGWGSRVLRLGLAIPAVPGGGLGAGHDRNRMCGPAGIRPVSFRLGAVSPGAILPGVHLCRGCITWQRSGRRRSGHASPGPATNIRFCRIMAGMVPSRAARNVFVSALWHFGNGNSRVVW